MKIKLILTFIISFVAAGLCQAHALWIETSSEGQLNKKHIVKVYYGEYAEQLIDSIDNWYSDVKDFEIFLTSPKGNKIKLDKQTNSDHFVSEFVPTEDGIYTISVIHGAKEAYETMRFEFSSIAFVKVGKQEGMTGEHPFHLKSLNDNEKLGSEINLAVYDNSIPQKETEVIIMGPEGWTKTLHSDASGKVSFKPFIPGKYIIEASKTDEKTENWNNQKIDKIWRGTTIAIQVK